MNKTNSAINISTNSPRQTFPCSSAPSCGRHVTAELKTKKRRGDCNTSGLGLNPKRLPNPYGAGAIWDSAKDHDGKSHRYRSFAEDLQSSPVQLAESLFQLSSHLQQVYLLETLPPLETTKVYEYVLSLFSDFGQPDFKIFKLIYALRLADSGCFDQSLQYCVSLTRMVSTFPSSSSSSRNCNRVALLELSGVLNFISSH
ncbi:hypothetical protein AOLI_G00198310 [Acnodon oligacanthus]